MEGMQRLLGDERAPKNVDDVILLMILYILGLYAHFFVPVKVRSVTV